MKLRLDSLGEHAAPHLVQMGHESLIPTVKCGGGNITTWACSAASGPGGLAVIEGKMSSQKHQTVLQGNEKRPGHHPSRSPRLNPAEMLITEQYHFNRGETSLFQADLISGTPPVLV